MRTFALTLMLFVACDDSQLSAYPDGSETKVVKREIYPEDYIDALTATDPAQEIVIADMRMVSVRFEDDSLNEHMVHVGHVYRLICATLALHHNPGINPHNGQPTAKISAISVSTPEFDGPYWWSTPSLEDKVDYWNGAMIIEWHIQRVWTPRDGWDYKAPQRGW